MVVPVLMLDGMYDVIACTWAVTVEEPKRPKTKPPIATEATSVTAMISTVAMIGEIALLWPCPYSLIVFILEVSVSSDYINDCEIQT